MSGRRAVVLGGTGLVGRYLVHFLLADLAWESVTLLGRRPMPLEHPKLSQHAVDFTDIESISGRLQGDDLFCCMGTTIKKAGSQAAFRHVDADIPIQCAELALANGMTRLLLVTSMGADSGSRFFYNRVKGDLEIAVRQMGFDAVHILRPSLLLGPRSESRPPERLARALFWLLGPLMVGPLRHTRGIHVARVAAAMRGYAKDPTGGAHLHLSGDLQVAGVEELRTIAPRTQQEAATPIPPSPSP